MHENRSIGLAGDDAERPASRTAAGRDGRFPEAALKQILLRGGEVEPGGSRRPEWIVAVGTVAFEPGPSTGFERARIGIVPDR